MVPLQILAIEISIHIFGGMLKKPMGKYTQWNACCMLRGLLTLGELPNEIYKQTDVGCGGAPQVPIIYS